MINDCELLYKRETGDTPVDEEVMEFEIWRSRGQWIINISDEEKFKIWGNQGIIEITTPDRDYVRWLEEKVIELLKQRGS